MNTYYCNSTIFDKKEDVVAALKDGKVVYNDDAGLKFKKEDFTRKKGEPRRACKLMICGKTEEIWCSAIVDWNNADSVIDNMDIMVDYNIYPRWLKQRKFQEALEELFEECGEE